MDNYQGSLAVRLDTDFDENERPLGPHLGGVDVPKPEPFEECRRLSSQPNVWEAHPASLTGREVTRVYEAIAFAMWKHGVILNTHITLNWAQMGVDDGATAVKLLGKYNAEAAKWLRVGAPGQPVQRASKLAGIRDGIFLRKCP